MLPRTDLRSTQLHNFYYYGRNVSGSDSDSDIKDDGNVCEEEEEDVPLELLVGGCKAFPDQQEGPDFPVAVRGRTEKKVFFSVEQTFLDDIAQLDKWAVAFQKDGEPHCEVLQEIPPNELKMYFDAECDCRGFVGVRLYVHDATFDETWTPSVPAVCGDFAGERTCEYSFEFACVGCETDKSYSCQQPEEEGDSENSTSGSVGDNSSSTSGSAMSSFSNPLATAAAVVAAAASTAAVAVAAL